MRIEIRERGAHRERERGGLKEGEEEEEGEEEGKGADPPSLAVLILPV